jgi:predicted TIM-barrel fold metal-dependent hydrolase
MIIDADAHFTPVLQSESCICQDWLQDYNNRKQGHFSSAEHRCRELDELGIDLQVQNPMGVSVNLTYDLDPAIAGSVMQIYNDRMHEINRVFPRLVPNLWLSMQDIEASKQEIYRNLDRVFFAVYLSDLPAWGYVDKMHEFWRLLESESIPLYLHLNHQIDRDLPVSERYRTRYQEISRYCTIDDQWMLSIASMIDSDMFSQYPNLKVILAERDINWFDTMNKLLGRDVLPLLRSNFWFTAEPEKPWFQSSIAKLGYDRVLFATDWPHAHDIGGANRYHDIDCIRGLEMSDKDRHAIFCGNYQNLSR